MGDGAGGAAPLGVPSGLDGEAGPVAGGPVIYAIVRHSTPTGLHWGRTLGRRLVPHLVPPLPLGFVPGLPAKESGAGYRRQSCEQLDLEALLRRAEHMTAKTASGEKHGTHTFDLGVNHCNRLQLL